MNPWNKLWIGLCWMIAFCGIVGAIGGQPLLAVIVLLVLPFLITAQTIGVDRSERKRKVIQ